MLLQPDLLSACGIIKEYTELRAWKFSENAKKAFRSRRTGKNALLSADW